MTAINHALTGSLIGLGLGNVLAWPLAFASHFLLDSLPHFGDEKRLPLGSRPFWLMLTVDGLLVLLLAGIILAQAEKPWVVLGAAGLAVSPDLSHLNQLSPRKIMPSGKLHKLHQRIQRSETPRGLIVELLWLLAGTLVLNRWLYA